MPASLAEPVLSHYLRWQEPAVKNASRWLAINDDISLHFVDFYGKVKVASSCPLLMKVWAMNTEWHNILIEEDREILLPCLIEYIHVLRAATRRHVLWQFPQFIYTSSFRKAPVLGYLESSAIYIHFLCNKLLYYRSYLQKCIQYLLKYLLYLLANR